MVAGRIWANAGCCFDFGNTETTVVNNGSGHMNAVALSSINSGANFGGSGNSQAPEAFFEGIVASGLFMGTPLPQQRRFQLQGQTFSYGI
jgi:Alpha-L-arabinofuranosidase B, catalytic